MGLAALRVFLAHSRFRAHFQPLEFIVFLSGTLPRTVLSSVQFFSLSVRSLFEIMFMGSACAARAKCQLQFATAFGVDIVEGFCAIMLVLTVGAGHRQLLCVL